MLVSVTDQTKTAKSGCILTLQILERGKGGRHVDDYSILLKNTRWLFTARACPRLALRYAHRGKFCRDGRELSIKWFGIIHGYLGDFGIDYRFYRIMHDEGTSYSRKWSSFGAGYR